MDKLKNGQIEKRTNCKMDNLKNRKTTKWKNRKKELHMATLKLKNTCDNAMKRKAIERSKVSSSSLR